MGGKKRKLKPLKILELGIRRLEEEIKEENQRIKIITAMWEIAYKERTLEYERCSASYARTHTRILTRFAVIEKIQKVMAPMLSLCPIETLVNEIKKLQVTSKTDFMSEFDDIEALAFEVRSLETQRKLYWEWERLKEELTTMCRKQVIDYVQDIYTYIQHSIQRA